MRGWLGAAFLAGCTHLASAPAETAPKYDDGPDKDLGDTLPATADYPEIAARNPRATALCREVFPCPPGSLERPRSEWPFMCALAGVRYRRPEHVPGLTVEMISCPYRRLGEAAIVGVPDDGSRPLLQGDALKKRVRGSPRVRAMLEGAVLDDPACPIVERGGVLGFCIRDHGGAREQCLLEADDSLACAREHPEKILAACHAARGARLTPIPPPLWAPGPGSATVPSDHYRPGMVGGPTDMSLRLRAGGKDVKMLACTGPAKGEYYFVDGDAAPIDTPTLVRRLDDDVMRATILAGHVDKSEWAVLLDPTGGPDTAYPAPRTCKLAPGPHRRGNSIDFFMTPATAGRPYVLCSADVTTLTGSCTPVPGTYCE